MDFSKNYRMKKPAAEDYYNIADYNANTDLIDERLLIGENAKTLADQLLTRVERLETYYNALANKAQMKVTLFGPAGCTVRLNSGTNLITQTMTKDMEVTLAVANVGMAQVEFMYNGYSYIVSFRMITAGHKYIPAPIPLERAPWSYIAKVSEHGLARTCWKVGDTKTLSVDGANVSVHILGFEHDSLYRPASPPMLTPRQDFTKAGITFGLVDILPTLHQVHGDETVDVTWATCDLRLKTLPALMATMDEELQAAVKKVRKITPLPGLNKDSNENGWAANNTAQATEDTLFIFSERDLYGTHRASTPYINYESEAYEYYRQGGAVVRSDSFWLRNAQYNSSTGKRYSLNVSTNNTVTISNNTKSLGLLFGFCI